MALLGTHDFTAFTNHDRTRAYETAAVLLRIQMTVNRNSILDPWFDFGGCRDRLQPVRTIERLEVVPSAVHQPWLAEANGALHGSAAYDGQELASASAGDARRDDRLTIVMEANGFLYCMCRIIVGTLLERFRPLIPLNCHDYSKGGSAGGSVEAWVKLERGEGV